MGFAARPPAPLHNRQPGQTKLSFTAYFLEKGEILAFSHYVGDFLIGFDKVSIHSLNRAVLNSLLNSCKCSTTLASGIDVGPTFINFGFFSRPYGLIREYIKVIYMVIYCIEHVYLRPYIYSFCQTFQALRLFRRLE